MNTTKHEQGTHVMDFNEHQKKMNKQIKTAEEKLAEDTDRLPIVSNIPIKEEEVHGYVKPGDQPVACTDALQPSLDTIVNDDGTITGEMIAGANEEQPHYTATLSPTDDDYIHLLNDMLSGYKIKRE